MTEGGSNDASNDASGDASNANGSGANGASDDVTSDTAWILKELEKDPPPPPLPSGWVIRFSRSQPGTVYYYNQESGVCVWPRPVIDNENENGSNSNDTKSTKSSKSDQTKIKAKTKAKATGADKKQTTESKSKAKSSSSSITHSNGNNDGNGNGNNTSNSSVSSKKDLKRKLPSPKPKPKTLVSQPSISSSFSSNHIIKIEPNTTSNNNTNTNNTTSSSSSISFQPPPKKKTRSKEPKEVRALHILKKHKASRRPASWRNPQITCTLQEAKEELEGLIEVLREASSSPEELRATFEELARTESDCSSAKRGGDLGFFGRKKMQPPFENASFALEVGELSGIVETSSGVHVILRIG